MMYVLVVFGRMMFGPVVSVVRFARMPVDAELVFAFMVLEPVEAHVHCLSVLGLDLLLTTASAMALSVWRGVAGCVGPNS